MPKTTPIQTNFNSGEISPRFLGHSVPDVYQTGVREAVNFFPVAQGPMIFRSGFRYITSVDGEYGRIFAFPASINENYFCILTDEGKIYVADDSGIPPGDNLVQNGNFNDGDLNWTVIETHPQASVTFGQGDCTMLHGGTAARYCQIQQNVTIPVPGNNHRLFIELNNSGTFHVMLGTTQGGNEIYEDTITGDTLDVQLVINDASVWITIETVVPDTYIILDYVVIQDLESASVGFPEFPTPYDAEDLRYMQADMPPGGFVLYFVTPKKSPYKLTYDRSTKTWDFLPMTITGQPAAWTGTNWPRSITFFQGRSWWGGTENTPETFWASKSGDYEDLTPGSQPDDGMEFTLANRGIIQWMLGLRNLTIGSETGEYIITSDGGVIIPGDIHADLQSSHGSRHIQAHRIGNRALYANADARKLYDMGYQWTDEGWVSRSLSFKSEHITRDNNITQIEWMENPETTILCLTENGTLLTCLYDYVNQIIGWTRHTSDGRCVDVEHLEDNGESNILALFKREGEPTKLYVEYVPSIGESDLDQHMDSYAFQSNVTSSDEIIGFPHLANMTVGVITDGAIHPDVTLDSEGKGELQWEADHIVVGLKYEGRFLSLPTESAGGFLSRATTGAMKRWNKIYVRIIASLKPRINGVRPPERHPSTPMNTGEPPITEDVQVTNLGYDKYGAVEIVQDLQIPTNIVALFGEMSEDIVD